MAYRQLLLLAVVAAVACLASHASAMLWLVGDKAGWRPGINSTGWADNKTFLAADTLMFIYSKGEHAVVQVGKEDFAACNLQGNQLGNWTGGRDLVPLDKPGKAWFICTMPNHCLNGMKLVVDVQAAPPAPPPSSAPISYTVGGAMAVAGALVAAVLAF